jgi:hypothetical protein
LNDDGRECRRGGEIEYHDRHGKYRFAVLSPFVYNAGIRLAATATLLVSVAGKFAFTYLNQSK